MDMINLTAEDLTANKKGQLSSQQKRYLEKQRLVWAAGTAGFVLMVVGLTAVTVWKIIIPEFAAQGQLFILLPLGLFWLWLLRTMPGLWRQTNRDLAAGTVDFVEGTAHSYFRLTIGLIQTARYYLQVDTYKFRLNEACFGQFKNGERYRIYYAPRSQTFLGGLRLVQPAASFSDNGQAPASLIEPLTRRELEILQLIATGLSNQEIADQLSLSINTVKMHASQVYQKLDVNRRAEAVARARQLHILK